VASSPPAKRRQRPRAYRGETVARYKQLNRRGGREGGGHLGGQFCSNARADGEGAPVRGRGSGRGGRRRGQGGPPWWRGACCRVGGVGKQSEKAAAGEVLTEEDDGG
jgi:hypothetical protein